MLECTAVGPQDADLLIVLCHGFGADERDLVPLAEAISTPVPARWLFPRAPWGLPSGWGTGRAWFPRDPGEIAAFATGETFANLAPVDPPALAESGSDLARAVRLCSRGSSRQQSECLTIVGGFSQGSMVACEALLGGGLEADGLVVLSGALIAAERWRAHADRDGSGALAGIPVFHSHGRADPVLPFAAGARLGTLLDEAGAARTFVGFDGGHGIPPHVVERLSAWIATVAV